MVGRISFSGLFLVEMHDAPNQRRKMTIKSLSWYASVFLAKVEEDIFSRDVLHISARQCKTLHCANIKKAAEEEAAAAGRKTSHIRHKRYSPVTFP